MVANRYSLQSMERIRQLIDERCGGSQQVFADKVDINKASAITVYNLAKALMVEMATILELQK